MLRPSWASWGTLGPSRRHFRPGCLLGPCLAGCATGGRARHAEGIPGNPRKSFGIPGNPGES
eukprot:1803068-Pyramimonas_sp.AAC.1